MDDQTFELRDSARETGEMVQLLEEEAPETCRAIQLADDYLVAIINPCLGPDEDRLVRLISSAPEMLALLKEAASGAGGQDFRNRVRSIVSAVEE